MVDIWGPRVILQGIFCCDTDSHSKILAADVQNQKMSEQKKPLDTKHRETLIGLQASETDEEGNRKGWRPEEEHRNIAKEHCVYERTVELVAYHNNHR